MWTDVPKLADSRNNFGPKPDSDDPDWIDNRPLTPGEIEIIKRMCLSAGGARIMSFPEAERQYRLNRALAPHPTQVTSLTDRLPFVDGQKIDHLQDLVNGQPSSVVRQASLQQYQRDPDPRVQRFGRGIAEMQTMAADIEARLDRLEEARTGDVPSADYRQTALDAEQKKYARTAAFSNNVTKYCFEQRKKGRPHLTYAQAEEEYRGLTKSVRQ